MVEFLIFKCDGTVTTKEAFRKQFEKNLQYPNGWAREFESFDECIKAWFW